MWVNNIPLFDKSFEISQTFKTLSFNKIPCPVPCCIHLRIQWWIHEKSIIFLTIGSEFHLETPLPFGISWAIDLPTTQEFPVPSVVGVWVYTIWKQLTRVHYFNDVSNSNQHWQEYQLIEWHGKIALIILSIKQKWCNPYFKYIFGKIIWILNLQEDWMAVPEITSLIHCMQNAIQTSLANIPLQEVILEQQISY